MTRGSLASSKNTARSSNVIQRKSSRSVSSRGPVMFNFLRSTAHNVLANDAARDDAFPKDVASLDALLAYMKAKKPSGLQLATARLAWQSYARGQAPDRPI